MDPQQPPEQHAGTNTALQPRIIPRGEHSISRKNIDREALKVLYRLRDAGFTAYLVGGGVRDLLIGKTPKDFDISTDARPGQIHNIFRNSRVIGRRFRLVQVFYKGGKIIEVSTFRCSSESEEAVNENGEDNVLPANNTFGTPAEDAFRRDLTINSLFYEIENFTVIDFTGGVDDLYNGIIRLIGDPDRKITRDPVRILRAIRHAARNTFIIEENSWRAILRHAEKLALCPVSRLRDELFKDLHKTPLANWLPLALESGALAILLPCYAREHDPAAPMMKLLLDLVTVIDRLHEQRGGPLDDPTLTALLLLPWAIHRLGVLTPRQGGELFHHSRKVRDGIDDALCNLNIKRADKEAIASLLTNLVLFTSHADQGRMPKKLQRKSYYRQCLLFYEIYREATSGETIEVELLPPVVVEEEEGAVAPPRGRRHATRAPAYARGKRKGGIFGLKK
ncbi:MAG: poly(A) polymerase [Thermodesulfobacteriota bacterium]